MSKKQPNKTINPFFIKGTNPSYLGINHFLSPESQSPPILNIDTESHFYPKEEDPDVRSPQ